MIALTNTSAHTGQRRQAVRVPVVSTQFWITALFGSASAVAIASWSTDQLGIGAGVLAVGFGLAVLGVSIAKIVARQAMSLFWVLYAMVALTGILGAKLLTVELAAPLPTAALLIVLLLIAALGAWHVDEGAISQRSVTTMSSESSYWSTWALTAGLSSVAVEWLWTPSNYGAAVLVTLILVAVASVGAARCPGAISDLCFWGVAINVGLIGHGLAKWLASPAHGGLGLGAGAAALLGLAGFSLAVFVGGGRRSSAVSRATKGDPRMPDSWHGAVDPAVGCPHPRVRVDERAS